MCCIFTCCGWLVDLVQRLWTFTMSCCICSSVCTLLSVGSMSGIALGYNYSLAEYMDLKETNVSIYLKRGVFDDELTELEWRRAGHKPVRAYDPNAGLKGIENQVDILEAGGTTVRSGRRLDDSVVDVGDANRYEGSLFKLTAKPPVEITTTPTVTGMNQFDRIASMYPKDSLESLKEIQRLIDSRKSMAQYYGGSTVSPVPTFPFQEAERMYPGELGGRREMGAEEIGIPKPSLSPARTAVPDSAIGNKGNWMFPKFPNIPFVTGIPDSVGPHRLNPALLTTYPSPITLRTGPIRPTTTSYKESVPNVDENIALLTRTSFTLFSTAQTVASGIEPLPMPDKAPTIETIKERFMMENNMPRRKQKPKPEEEYDYDIKGLPVRKRRSADEGEKNILHDEVNKVLVDQDKTNNILSPVPIKQFLVSYITDFIKNNKQNKLSLEKVNDLEDKVRKESIESDVEDKAQSPEVKVSKPKSDLIARLISKVKSLFKMNLDDKVNTDSSEVNYEDQKNTNNLIGSEIVSSEYKVNPINTDVISVDQTTIGDHKPSADNILGYVYNEKDLIKSTSSVLVNMLISTIT